MADFGEQIEEIKALLSSQNKALAYPKLLHFQEISAIESSAIQMLSDSCPAILSSVVDDIFDNDEEIAAQALKCLGFMIYHPTIVVSLGGDDADVIIESLVKVILTTKIKSVCNLGVWCISIQQFSSSLLDQHLQSLLRAVTHALDNPSGSLSITFEAMQAVVKLAGSLTEQMRNMSSLWTPPIYRRLVSVDKRDRDMSERCLLKIMPLICPPPVALSKALAVDMKKKLLLAMKELMDKGMKVQSLQAWEWFIRLLGPYALKNKRLLNEMLNILEQTFSDFDSQVRIASLVAWEGLIDVLVEPGVQASLINSDFGHSRRSEANSSQNEADRHAKRIKLILAPLIGIMSSKCDVSVHASCLSTWSYLLHKLEAAVSCQLVIKIVWEPIIELVFQVAPDNKNIWLWNFSFELLNTLILGRNKQGAIGNLYNQKIRQLSTKSAALGHLAFEKCSLRHYPINSSPWNLNQLAFFIRMISMLINRESDATVSPEFRRLASDAALILFESLTETVQKTLLFVSTTYDEVMLCLNSIFRFLGKMCETVTSEDNSNCHCPHECLKFLKVASERLEASILGSPLYKMSLEITKLKSATEIRRVTFPGVCLMDFEDRVLPILYLSTLYLIVVVNSSPELPQYETLLQQMQGYLSSLLSSYNPQDVLHAFICFLYKNTKFNSLLIWIVIVNCFKECMESKMGQFILKMDTDMGYSIILHLLSYPFASWTYSQIEHELETVIEVWEFLYVCIDKASQSMFFPAKFSEDLCEILNVCVDQITLVIDTGTEFELRGKKFTSGFDPLCGNIIICVLKQLTSNISSKQRHDIDYGRRSKITNSMGLAARFMKLFCMNKELEPSHLSVASRFLSELAKFVGCLRQKEDVLMLVESISSPLLEWLSEMHLFDENTNCELQLLWRVMLKVLQQTQPPMKFDSSFLKFQENLLERALDHPNPAISEPTINFWNSTYGALNNLEFPKNLILVLDKLTRNKKINICSRNQYNVTHTLKKCSNRVEIVGNPVNALQDLDNICLGGKRRRLELTEHQKEVRRAQQGRTWDSDGHGPGIRTYTDVDFSQGNEESQDTIPQISGLKNRSWRLKRKFCSNSFLK